MNRRSFLKTCLGGAAAVVAAPLVALTGNTRRELTYRERRNLVEAILTHNCSILEAGIKAGYPLTPGKLIRSSEDAHERLNRRLVEFVQHERESLSPQERARRDARLRAAELWQRTKGWNVT